MTYQESESRIRSIALRSSSFKIGKTGQHEYKRLKQHPDKFRRIDVITFSAERTKIENFESKMIDVFKNWKTCENKIKGSAGVMKESDKYILYVIYVLKRL